LEVNKTDAATATAYLKLLFFGWVSYSKVCSNCETFNRAQMFLSFDSAINFATSELVLVLKSITFLAHILQNDPFALGIILLKFSWQGVFISKENLPMYEVTSTAITAVDDIV
jgi:hypothetical protein